MSLLILTRLQPGEQLGIFLLNRFNGFPRTYFKKENVCTGWNGDKSETVETVRKEDWQPVHLAEAR